MSEIHRWHNDTCYTEPLPIACRQCADGSKMVVLVTGRCTAGCPYCPLSYKKHQKDDIYADEWQLLDEEDTDKLIEESDFIDATGAGITGGDPLYVWERAKRYITLLKDTFGPDYHIHLYTSGIEHPDKIPQLIEAGLDEIRFHPRPEHWMDMDNSTIAQTIKDTTARTDIKVAIEIPVFPEKEEDIIRLIRWAEESGIDWINLNELEFSEQNEDYLHTQGYAQKGDLSAAVKGSEETALAVIDVLSKEDLRMGMHYCSVSFKDGVQLKNRLSRRAHNTVQPYQLITKDSTLLSGIIETSSPLDETHKAIKEEYGVPCKMMTLDLAEHRILIAPWILEDIACELIEDGHDCFLIETYPTADALEVERIPLPLSDE